MCDGLYLILLKRFWSASSISWVIEGTDMWATG